MSARVSVVGIVRARDLHAGHLTERVDAGVGAPGAVHGDRRAFEARERILEQALDGVAFGLPLPADEARAVVGERELESAHIATTPQNPGFTTGCPAAQSGQASGW